MINQELEDNIKFAHFDARRRGLDQVSVEHLVLVLLDNSAVQTLLRQSQVDSANLRLTLSAFLSAQTQQNGKAARPMPSESFRRVLKRALEQRENKAVNGAHILAAVLAEPDSHAAHCLSKYGIDRLTVIAHLAEHSEQPPPAPSSDAAAGEELVAKAAAGRLEKPFGRERETWQLMRVLSHKYKNNPLLVGEAGVGKTRIVHALAHAVAAGNAPPPLKNMKIQNVSLSGLIAGTKYRGDFEQRLQTLLQHCREQDGTVIFMDEIHTLIGSGAVSGGALDAANILKPALDDEGIRCIGATTSGEFHRIFKKDSALARRFQKIDVEEPDDAELERILSGVIGRLSQHHDSRYEETAVASSVRLSRRYLPNRRLPDKAIDLLDAAGARRRLGGGKKPIGDKELIQVAREAAGVPANARHDQRRQLATLAAKLKSRVFCQNEAADRLARAVLRARLGLDERRRAAGAFLFAGPTGVGKTEMARQLALLLECKLLRYDMSEYREMHTVSRLIGAPPGYVGFEQSGRLTEGIAQHPGAVVLFDEIEKAHPDVLNVLLQIMDYGVLTDNNGRAADFSNALLIMTSNAGAEAWERPPVGFGREDAAEQGDESLRRLLAPEFRNRLDAIVPFQPLPKTALRRILNAQLSRLGDKLRREKKVTVTFGKQLRARLLADGIAAGMGARPLERLIRERVVDAVAAAEVGGKLTPGGSFLAEENVQGGLHLTTVAARGGDGAAD